MQAPSAGSSSRTAGTQAVQVDMQTVKTDTKGEDSDVKMSEGF